MILLRRLLVLSHACFLFDRKRGVPNIFLFHYRWNSTETRRKVCNIYALFLPKIDHMNECHRPFGIQWKNLLHQMGHLQVLLNSLFCSSINQLSDKASFHSIGRSGEKCVIRSLSIHLLTSTCAVSEGVEGDIVRELSHGRRSQQSNGA